MGANAVRPGREAGVVCNASSPDGKYACTLPAGHPGDMHWFSQVGQSRVSWRIAGLEPPPEPQVEVQCPNCNYIFNAKDGKNVDTHREARDGQVVDHDG